MAASVEVSASAPEGADARTPAETAERDRDRRRQRSRRTREAMGAAAFDLLLERGLAGVSVEAIAERTGVTRRTFSRHFTGKEDAVLAVVADDVHRINDALRLRPSGEGPMTAYRNAVVDWLTAEFGGDRHALLRRRLELFRRIDREPALIAAYQRIRADAEEESVRVVAARMGVDPAHDPRPAVAVGAGAGTLVAVLRAWARHGVPESPARLVGAYFDALAAVVDPRGDAAEAAPHADPEGPPPGRTKEAGT
ncbi:TetR/AcrR family transcriptional regulator [Streptomycetaceae bacterium NBC_01309]